MGRDATEALAAAGAGRRAFESEEGPAGTSIVGFFPGVNMGSYVKMGSS